MMLLTQRRYDWLKLLAEQGPQMRGKGLSGYSCATAGWTEDNLIRKDNGQEITCQSALKLWGEYNLWNHVLFRGERITGFGRWLLREGKIGKKYSDDENKTRDPNRKWVHVSKPVAYDQGRCWGIILNMSPTGAILMYRHCHVPPRKGMRTCVNHADHEAEAAAMEGTS